MVSLFAVISGCNSTQRLSTDRSVAPTTGGDLRVFAELSVRPSGVATWNDRVFVSVPRTGSSVATVYEVVEGEFVPYPNREMQDDIDDPNDIVSVYGLRVDDMGRLWMVDNAVVAMRQSHPEAVKVVVWAIDRGEEAFRRSFGPDSFGPDADESSSTLFDVGSAVLGRDDAGGHDVPTKPIATSWTTPGFLNDVAIDEEQGVAYFTDSGIFSAPAILVYDFVAEHVLRRLNACPVVEPDDEMSLTLDGAVIEIGAKEERESWRAGANPIALLPNGNLLTGAMTSAVLFEVSAAALRDNDVLSSAVCESASPWARRSITDGINADSDGETLWVTNVQDSRVDGYQNGTIVRSYQLPMGSFPISIDEYGDDLLVVTNQLQRAAIFHDGVEHGEPPYVIYRIER